MTGSVPSAACAYSRGARRQGGGRTFARLTPMAAPGQRATGENTDVVVAGSGPAGLATAAACARAGLRVTLVDPRPAPWRATYCLWADEAEAAARSLGLGSLDGLVATYDR